VASRFSASNVTVAVSNYNGIAIVGSCLASIGRLNAAPAEIIVLDDGSTDASVAYLREHFPLVRVIEMGVNSGGILNKLRNRALAEARTDFVFLVDNDVTLALDCLDQLLRGWPDNAQLAREILICEQDGDRITHDIIRRLNETFVTPIDREDIYALASALDDIVDFTEEVADFLGLYRIEAPTDQAQRMAAVLHEATRQINGAIPREGARVVVPAPFNEAVSALVRALEGGTIRSVLEQLRPDGDPPRLRLRQPVHAAEARGTVSSARADAEGPRAGARRLRPEERLH